MTTRNFTGFYLGSLVELIVILFEQFVSFFIQLVDDTAAVKMTYDLVNPF